MNRLKAAETWTCTALAVVLSITTAYSQSERVSYYEHIEPIVIKNCSGCHQPGKSAPFSLLTFEDVRKRGEFIANVTRTQYMPPWKADTAFQSYKNARVLTRHEVGLISKWVEAGMPKGKKKKGATLAVETPDRAAPDLSLRLPEPYLIPADGKDDYRFFNLPTNLPADQFVTRIEFIPGNPRLVHHSRLMTDTSHKVRSIHGLSANDPRMSEFEKYPPIDKFLYGWVPGNFPITFPEGAGKKLHKDTDIILNIHYSPNRRESQADQSTVNFYFAKGPVSREVYSLAIAEENISNPPFVIHADEKKTFYSSFGPIPVDITVLAVLPHMHYLGKTFKAFAITPNDSAIHLIKIDAWDFKWQDTYQFRNMLHIPKGSVILMEGTFDNTAQNPSNPTLPPKDVTYGWNSTSEMFDLVLYYMVYQAGDGETEQ
jgi:mono/diheme cytochrome c family protein